MSQRISKNLKMRASYLRKLAGLMGVPSLQEEVAKHSTVLRTIDRNCLENLRAHDNLFKNYQTHKVDYEKHIASCRLFTEGTVKVYKKLRKDLNTLTSIVLCLGILTLLSISLTILSLLN